MKFTYAPEGQPPQLFDFDANEFDTDQAEAIEEAGGTQWQSFGQWANLLNAGGFRAWRVALWIMLRKTKPELAFEEVRPKVGQIIPDYDNSEPEEKAVEESAEGNSETGDESTSSP